MSDRKQYLKDYKKSYLKENKSVSVMLKNKDYNRLISQSKKQNTKPTTYAKEIILSKLNESSLVDYEVREKLDDLNFILRNVANNVNQIAKHSNRIKCLRDEHALLDHLRVAYESLERSILKNDN